MGWRFAGKPHGRRGYQRRPGARTRGARAPPSRVLRIEDLEDLLVSVDGTAMLLVRIEDTLSGNGDAIRIPECVNAKERRRK
jgi:hypothetical protein